MSSLNNLEHEGNEFFNEVKVTNRKEVTETKEQVILKNKKLREGALAKLQEDWLHIDNPFLWDGEID